MATSGSLKLRGTTLGALPPKGTITEFAIPTTSSRPKSIISGPDHNLWFTEVTGNKIGRITPGGTITEFPVPTANSKPVVIASGPDGNLWFTENTGNNIARITPKGTITEFPVPTASLKHEIERVLLSMHHRPRAAEALRRGLIEKFVPVTDDHYRPIHDMFALIEGCTADSTGREASIMLY